MGNPYGFCGPDNPPKIFCGFVLSGRGGIGIGTVIIYLRLNLRKTSSHQIDLSRLKNLLTLYRSSVLALRNI